MNAVLKKIINQQMDAFNANICSSISKLPDQYKKRIALLAIVLLSLHFSQAQLIANFNPTQSSLCVNTPANFFDQSKFAGLPLPASTPIYTWTFDDGAGHKLRPQANTRDIQMVFTSGGIWQITMDVEYNGFKDSKTGMIFVADNPAVQFTANKNRGCMPLSLVFTDNTIPFSGLDKLTNINYVDAIISRTWDFDDGYTSSDPVLKSTSHTYNNAAIYSPTLIVTTKLGCTANFRFTDMITVDPAVLASFDAPIVSIACEFPTNPVQPTNVGLANAYLWTIDGGASITNSTAQYPDIRFPKAGTYTLTLKVTSVNGCENSITKSIDVPPIANSTDFSTPAGLTACQNTAFTFVRKNTPTTPTSYQWEVDGIPYPNFNDKNLEYAFMAAGVHTISLTALYNTGCSSTKTYNINVNTAPVANFDVPIAVRSSCKTPFTVNFTDLSSGNTQRKFDYGDGTPIVMEPSSNSATHTYTKAGNYTVSLIAINSFGCSDTTVFVNFIQVQVPKLLDKPYTNMPDSFCAKKFIPLADFDISSQITAWDWQIIHPDQTITTYTTKVPGEEMFGDQGVYKISLSVTTNTGCVSNPFTWEVKVGKQPPIPIIIVDQPEKCANLAFKFSTSTSGLTGFKWEFSDGTQSKDPTLSKQFGYLGDFYAKLTVYNNGCANSTDGQFKVSVIGVIAIFDELRDCNNPLQRKFIDNSTGKIDSELWNFGDGVTQSFTSKQTNFLYNYTKTGVYTVSLTVKDMGDTHCEYTRSATIKVANEKNVSFTPSANPICIGDSKVDLIAKVENPAMVSKYEWDLGCGFALKPASYSVDFKTLCLYSTNGGRGNYPTQLKVTDVNNCTYVTPIQNLFIGGPKADYAYATNSPRSGCELTTVRFDDKTTSDGVYNDVKRFWDFGDGVPREFPGVAEWRFDKVGIYPIRLISIDNNGCTDTIQKLSVTITKPIIDFTAPTQSCPGGEPIQFQLTKNVSLKSVRWDFADGQISTNENPPPIFYITTGKKTIVLQAEDFYGCKVSVTKPDYIEIGKPLAAFVPNYDTWPCPPFPAIFNFTGSFAEKYEWTFGDGSRSFQPNPTHVYTKPGEFDVNLRVISPGGCTSNFGPYNITVQGPIGIANFKNILCNANDPTMMSFTFPSEITVASDNTKYVTINYGDGQFNNQMPYTPSSTIYNHIYTDTGFYQPQISITDDNFCTIPLQVDYGIKAVSILPKFKSEPLNKLPFFCDSGTVTLKDISLSNEPITGWEWDYGDGTTGTGNPSPHFYASPRLYDVTFRATSKSGCVSTFSVRKNFVEVQARPDMDISSTLPEVCEDGYMSFSAVNNNPTGSPISDYFWDFSNGDSAVGKNPLAEQFRKAGEYPVKLFSTNAKGCVDTTVLKFLVNPLPSIDAGADTFLCFGLPLKLEASGAQSYKWTGPFLVNPNQFDPIISPTDDAIYTVRGTSLKGCEATDSIAVHVVQPSTIVASKDVSICAGDSVQLNAYGTDVLEWSPSLGLIGTTLVSPIAKPNATTTYFVTGKDLYGCFSTQDDITVTVNSLPEVNFLNDTTTIMAGTSILLTPTYSADVTRVEWKPSTFLDDPLSLRPRSTPQYSTTYTVFAYTDQGCKSKDVIHIYATCTNENLFIPNTFSPNNDGMNDLFYPRGRGIQKIKTFKIFNRWGQLVFVKENFFANESSAAWDGKKNGTYVTPDVYVYMIDIICENGNLITLKGDVTLIR